ncbi:MAG: hypothetical protein WC723_02170 [Candidatus Omnitrophota bacterium]
MFSTYVAAQPYADSDLDLQGTAYSLVHYLTPGMLTDRKTTYNFSHPLLPAFCAANTILFFDNLEGVKYYYDASLEVNGIKRRKPFVGEKITLLFSDNRTKEYSIIGLEGDKARLNSEITGEVTLGKARFIPPKARTDYTEGLSGQKDGIDYKWVREAEIWNITENCYARFWQSPYLVSTRSSQFLFTALTVIVLLIFILQITGSYFLSIFGSLLYLAIPEILLSLSITDYEAITSFAIIAAAYLYYSYNNNAGKKKEMRLPLFISGFLCAVSDHKTLILIMAILARDFILAVKNNEKRPILKSVFGNYIFIGFILGVLAYWIYGLMIDARMFIIDHFLYHFLDRVLHINEFGYTGYLSVSKLWLTYGGYLGWPLFLLSLYAVVYYLRFIFNSYRNETIFSLWFIIGAIAFTWIDFRQTYHLVYITPALIIAVFKWLSERRTAAKIIFTLILVYVGISHVWTILELTLGLKGVPSVAHWLGNDPIFGASGLQ